MGHFEKVAENEYVYVVGENEQRTDNSFQTASWYEVHALEAGTYPVTLTDIHYNKVDTLAASYYARVIIPSTVIDSSFPSTLMGYTAAGPKHVNKPSQYHISMYSYGLDNVE